MDTCKSRTGVSGIVVRGGLFLLIWWILSGGTPASWWVGVPAVLLALAVSVMMPLPVSVVWYELLRFIPFFLSRSLLGGLDVAWRAMHPRLPIAPEIVDYRLRLPPGLPQVLMANTVNLLPGTLSVDLDEGRLRVHVLDARKGFLAELDAVEHGVGRIFGLRPNIQ